MDGTSDDEEDERIANGDLSRDLRQDDDDLMDPVDVRLYSANVVNIEPIISSGATDPC